MVGLPGSGKSTIAKSMTEIKDDCVVLSSDELRKTFKDKCEPKSLNYHTFRHMNKTTVELLKQGTSVIYDATNLTRRDRKQLLKELKKNKVEDIIVTALVIETPTDICAKRNREREVDRVPDDVMTRYIEKYTPPILDEDFTYIVYMKGV